MTLSHILMALAGAALGTAVCGLFKAYPDKRSIVVLLLLAVFGSAAAGVVTELGPDCTNQPTTVRPLPDPDDCVQLGWLDGAWRCIPTEEAG